MNRTYLTAALALTARLPLRLDGTPPEKKDEKPPVKDEQLRLTPEEWAEHERAKVSKLSTERLVDELVKVKGENFDLRRKAAPDGGLVLNAAERAAWEKYQTFGKPEELGPLLETAKTDRQKVVQREKADHLGSVAKAAGWDAGALADLDQMAGGLEWTVQSIKDKDGNDVQQVTVKDGDKQRDAAEFAKERWSKFLPVLEAEAGEGKTSEETSAPAAAPKVPVGGAGGGKTRTPSVDEAKQRKQESGQYTM